MVVRINMILILVCFGDLIFRGRNLNEYIVLDEFSSQDEDDDITSSRNSMIQGVNRRTASNASMPKIISRCKAIYAYSPKLDDELEINPGWELQLLCKLSLLNVFGF